MKNPLQRRSAADLTRRRSVLCHPVDHLEEVTVRTAVLVERHGSGKASIGRRVSLARVKPFAIVAALVVALVLPGAASAHATMLRTTPANRAVLAAAPTAVTVLFDD